MQSVQSVRRGRWCEQRVRGAAPEIGGAQLLRGEESVQSLCGEESVQPLQSLRGQESVRDELI